MKEPAEEAVEGAPAKRRRRGRRGGARRRGRKAGVGEGGAGAADETVIDEGLTMPPEGDEGADPSEAAEMDAPASVEPVQEAAEAMTAPPAEMPREQVDEIQSTPTLAVDKTVSPVRGVPGEGSGVRADVTPPSPQGETPSRGPGTPPPPPPAPPVGGAPRVNPPAGGFVRPGVLPGVGRMSFSKGMGRHVFRPSGFRPPRPAVPPVAGESVPPAVSGESTAMPPLPEPHVEQPVQRPPQPQGGQHAMHRGPRPPQGGAGAPRGNQLAPGQQRQPEGGRGQQQRGQGGQQQGHHGPHRGSQLPQPRLQQGGGSAQPVRVSPPLAHGQPGVSGTGHRGPQVIARAPEPAPDTVALPPVPEGTDLSETSALAPVPAADSAAIQPPTPQDAEALAPFAEDIEIEEAVAPAKRREPTGRDMIINVAEGEEIRIAIVRRGMLEELYMERSSTESHVGNIYKGRVTNVEPSIQAAFIDFGIGKNGFLHISDLHPQYFKQNRAKGGHHGRGPQRAQAQHAPQGAPAGENAPEELPPGSEVPAAQSTEPGPEAFVSAYTNGDVESDELLDDYEVEDPGMKPMERVGRKTPRRERPPIQQCLRRGQEVIVQVTKEGIGTKGPTLTSYISCPGRYLVMMPGMSALGVSRKIEDEEQRRELRKVLLDLAPPKNLGFIIRTAGTDVSKRELQGDLNYLVRMWKVIANRIRTHRAPVELYQESDLVIRTIRDVFNDEIDRIIIDNEQVASRVRDFLSIVNPRSAGVVELYTGTLPIFQKYNVEREIEKIHSRRVEMANGGSLVIDSTEALVAIDVNSGRYREMRDAELTAFNMNKEALKEVCRQLRLRDLGGVVVIDFIDMREEKHKREIERLLKEELKNDRAKTKVLRMSLFCMVEMTRQRVRPSLKRSIYMDCPHCHGSALIKTPESVSLDVMRRVAAATVRAEIARIDVRVYPTVAAFVLNRKRKQLVELEERSGKRINITADANLAGDAIVIEGLDGRGSLLNLVL